MPLLLADMFPTTLYPAALFALISNLVVVLLGPQVGHIVDNNDRIIVVGGSLVLQNAMVGLCGIVITLLASLNVSSPFETWYSGVLYIVSIFLGGIIALSQTCSDVAIEKDWAIILSESDLSSTNAMLKRINLICEILAPLAFSFLLTFMNAMYAALVIADFYLISFIPEAILLIIVYRREPKLQTPKKAGLQKDNIMSVLINGWKTYLRQEVFLASFSYVLLYITVLTPGVLITAYLKSKGFQDIVIGVFRAIGAISGVSVTFVTPYAFHYLGVEKSGLISIWFQLGCLTIGLALVTLFDQAFAIYLLLAMIILSRMGLWAFDLAEVEIMQSKIKEDERGLVNATERAFTNLAFILILFLGVVLNDPKNFYYLMVISYDCIFIATVSYTTYYFLYRTSDVKKVEEQFDGHLEDHVRLEDEEIIEKEDENTSHDQIIITDDKNNLN